MIRRKLVGTVRPEPTGITSPCSSARSSFTCTGSGISATSSRNSVPPLASTSRPARGWSAPVNAPRTWPNSSLSASVGIEGGDVHRHERPAAPAAVAVNRPGDQLLAGAALAGEHHAGFGRSDQRDPLEDLLHHRRAADQAVRLAVSIATAAPAAGWARARSISRSIWARSNGLAM